MLRNGTVDLLARGIEERPFTVKSRGSPPVYPFGCSANHSMALSTRCAVNVFSTGTPESISFELSTNKNIHT
ncbi:hypothetical protein ALC53_11963 [Atta colombica]|uniref:Uncharacterized protein n=1 Tax=Atta colombica TaxID=520822 RepID=A0A195B000_9HYME|nr:hypothetical protein ALC53_11963 [Atta colombica]